MRPQSEHRQDRLQDSAGTLFAEGINFLAGETDEEAVLLLVVRDELDDVSDGGGHGDPLDGRLPPQLLRHSPLLL